MSCNLDYIDPKDDYSKRFPTDCKDKTPNTKHFLNDSNADIQLYSLYQSLSYSVEIKNEKGFSHDLQFVTWCGDSQSFIVKDSDNIEYKICISRA